MKKNYNRYTSFADRFPFIVVALILVFAIIFVFQFRAKFTFPFFSGSASAGQTQTTTQQTSQTQQYSMLISSPANGQVFSFTDENGTVPIKIDSKEDITNTNYKINLVLNDGPIIKTFSLPPYEYNWNPVKAGSYQIAANLVDATNNRVSSSNMVRFSVEYAISNSNTSNSEISGTTASAVDHSVTVDLQIEEGPTYSPDSGIFYYRVRAIVTGDPMPTVVFSKDDSNGVWGATIAQVNLRKGQSYNLGVIASNTYDSKNANITLTAPLITPNN